MKQLDKDVVRFAALNITAALIASPDGLKALIQNAEVEGLTFPEHAAKIGKAVATSVLSRIEGEDLFQFAEEDPIGMTLRAYGESRAMPGRLEAEDRMTEGELASNAVALIDSDRSRWDGSEESNPFPGDGAQDGDGRINDLTLAVFYLLSEIHRLGRAQDLSEQLHAETLAAASAAGEAVPVDVEQILDQAGDAPETQH